MTRQTTEQQRRSVHDALKGDIWTAFFGNEHWFFIVDGETVKVSYQTDGKGDAQLRFLTHDKRKDTDAYSVYRNDKEGQVLFIGRNRIALFSEQGKADSRSIIARADSEELN